MVTLPSCLALLEDGGAIAEPDADIAGIGVILAFLLSAYLTLAAVTIAYLSGLVDDGLLRPADRLVLRAPSRAARHPFAHSTLRRFVLTLSDQQIVTGIAILAAGFQGLRLNQISVYHFQIVIYLAWMSSSVHLSALTLLRPYLFHHRGIMYWRVVGMMVLLIMLMVSLVPTVSNDWAVVSFSEDPEPGPTIMGIPARCFWGITWGDGVNPDAIVSFLILILSYTWKMGGLFASSRKTLDRWIRYPMDGFMERILAAVAKKCDSQGGIIWHCTFRLSLSFILPGLAVNEVLSSFSAALWLSLLGLIYGTFQVLVPRALEQSYTPGLAASENQWQFGQLVPLILLVQPFGALLEFVWLRREELDETPYEDYGGTYSYGANLGDFQDGNRLVGLRQMPLLKFMASFQTVPFGQQNPQRSELKAFLYTSRLFASEIWLVHAATAATAGVCFWIDYLTIGFTSSQNWVWISAAVAIWLVITPVFTLAVLPFSRLGGYTRSQRKSSTDVLEGTQGRPMAWLPMSLRRKRPEEGVQNFQLTSSTSMT